MTVQAALPPRALSLGLVHCHACGAVCRLPAAALAAVPTLTHVHTLGHCPRCRAALHRRKPHSIARTWALLVAALILYVPANVLPVMYTTMLGRGGESTILGGVVDFWHEGSIDIALIIFIASVAVPSTKFVVLSLLLITVQRASLWAPVARARMYRLVELIGYWSMLDVVVVALVCALVQFEALGIAEPRLGIVFFGATVVLTMLAATTFDPRLIWDAESADG
jgi:paraquat-inducible protein A